MSDRSAASIGMVLAGVVLAVASRSWITPRVLDVPGIDAGWNAVGAALAVVALAAFALRRYGLVDRTFGAAVALGASAAVVLAAVLAVVMGVRRAATIDVATALTVLAGLGGVAAAYLDSRSVGWRRIVGMSWRASKALGVGFLGLLVGNVLGAIPILVFRDLSATMRFAVLTPLFGLGLGLVAFAFLSATDRDVDYLDVRVPDRRDGVYMLGGTIIIFTFLVLLGVLSKVIGLPSAQSGIVEQARRGSPEILLVLIPLSWLVIGPGEELLFRNVVQKYLYEDFSRPGAVVVACAIFALMHAAAYFTSDAVALTTTLVRLFFLSLVLGVSYERTENLVVPIVIHGTFNALQFAWLYMSLRSDDLSLWLAAGL